MANPTPNTRLENERHHPRKPTPGRSRVMAMPHQKPRKQEAKTWREVRAEAVKAGRLNEEALKAHRRRLLAQEHAHAERQQIDEDNDS